MRVVGLKVLRLKDVTRVPGLYVAFGRAVLLVGTLGLAGLFGRNGRGLHDLAFGCVVVRD
jgi:uncharacterized RDD family membrane protein YckC